MHRQPPAGSRVDMTIRTIGPFEIERQIGVGGMGLVYSAIYPETGKRVAVKILSPGLIADPKLLKRFEREIEILNRLNHPNIVKYYGGGTENNQRYFAMEFIDKGSLQQVLKKRGRLSWDKAIHVGRQVSSALEHAHNAGIIHRDLKPANLFLSTKGKLKLGDFGIARDTEATALTAAGKTVGTYAYMAPEQIQAGLPITRKTDLYALGCLLYEVIVGETPFQSENPMDMLMQHMNDDPYDVREKVPDCPPQLDRLIGRLLAKEPDDRPYDALAVHTELGEIRDALAKSGTGAALAETVAAEQLSTDADSPDTQKKKTKRKKKKKKKPQDNVPFHERTWFLVTCLVVLIGVTAFFMRPHSEEWYRDNWREAMQQPELIQRSALENYIDKYLQDFPAGRFREEAQELSDELHANKLESPLKNYGKTGIDENDHPFEAECADAAKLEDLEGLIYVPTWDTAPPGDLKTNPLPSMERWRRLITRGEDLQKQIRNLKAGSAEVDKESNADFEEKADDVATSEQSRLLLVNQLQIHWLTELCRNHHDYFRSKFVAGEDSRRFLHDRMTKAEELFLGNDTEKQDALQIWTYCSTEFARVERFQDFAEYAQLRISGSDAEVPSAASAGRTSAEPEKPDET